MTGELVFAFCGVGSALFTIGLNVGMYIMRRRNQ